MEGHVGIDFVNSEFLWGVNDFLVCAEGRDLRAQNLKGHALFYAH